MNASTPERFECIYPKCRGWDGECVHESKCHVAWPPVEPPMRVEEPAGEPVESQGYPTAEADSGVGRTTRKADTGGGFHPATVPNSPPERVAQSANSDVRELAEWLSKRPEDAGPTLVRRLADAVLALPVPVGDETEALRAAADVAELARRAIRASGLADEPCVDYDPGRCNLNAGGKDSCAPCLARAALAALPSTVAAVLARLDRDASTGECTCNVDNGYPCDVHSGEAGS